MLIDECAVCSLEFGPGRTQAQVEVVRVYEDLGRCPGEYRVLVDRLWPRGLTKTSIDLDEWLRDVAPSTELRRWYGHDQGRFTEFVRRYQAELNGEPGASAVSKLRKLAAGRRLVLLTATRDIQHSSAVVLQQAVAERGVS
jgi:uncharacterized protein YeaO (DUF488 family)